VVPDLSLAAAVAANKVAYNGELAKQCADATAKQSCDITARDSHVEPVTCTKGIDPARTVTLIPGRELPRWSLQPRGARKIRSNCR
jgi:hypothetical protein